MVALESTLITHGLAWPSNLETAQAAEAAVRDAGAVPATIAIGGRRLRIGLTDAELEAVARAPEPWKVSRANLAAALGREEWSGTTVSATMIAAHMAGIGVFATGGIGGVHRGGERSMDISADLDELARTPLAVICAGPKSILDVPRTMEVLETRGVPVVGWGTDQLPGFYSRESGLALSMRVDGAREAAALVRRQRELGLSAAVLFTVPPPESAALSRDEAEAAIAQAIEEAEASGVHGPASSPWVLSRVAELTAGRSIEANVALIVNNARVAAGIAIELAQEADPR